MESSHVARNSIIGALIAAIVILGIFFFTKIFGNSTPHNKTPLDNPFETSETVPVSDNPRNSRPQENYFDYAPTATESPSASQAQPEYYRSVVSTAPSYITFSQPFVRYSAPRQETSKEPVRAYPADSTDSTQATNDTEISYDPNYSYGYIYNTDTHTTTPVRVTRKRPVQNSDDGSGFSFKETDQEVFGYVSGTGWTQYLGTVGEQAFSIIYSLTPQGATGNTIGNFLPGGGSGSGGGGGGFGGGGFGGGGGGGATQNFGTMTINRITECTCSGSRLLDMSDVRGYTLSLLLTPGSQVKDNAKSMYGVTVGMKALGDYVAGGACYVVHGEECDTEGNPQGSIRQMGTSQ